MEFFTHPMVAFFILIGPLVFFHEAGHFVVGRLCGIAVEIFSLGFGPVVASFDYKGTNYRLSWLPLGGFVKFAGMLPSEEVPEGLVGKPFREAGIWQRAATIAAGPIANLILAFFAYSLLGYNGIPHMQPKVGSVKNDSAAQEAGLQLGDLILAIDGKEIKTWPDMVEIIQDSPDKPIRLRVERDGEEISLTLKPHRIEAENIMGKQVEIGQAGIGMGAVPAIVALTSQDGLGAKAGLKTGDRVRAVMVDGEWRHINYWRHFTEALAAAKGGEVRVKVFETNLDGKTKGLPRELSIQTAVVAADKSEDLDAPAEAIGVTHAQLVVGERLKGADRTIKPLDRILAWNGKPVRDVYDYYKVGAKNKEPKIDFTVQRGFENITISVEMKEVELQLPAGKEVVYQLPVGFLGRTENPEPIIEKYDDLLSAFGFGFNETVYQTTFLTRSVGKMFSGDVPIKAMGGVILMAVVAGESVKAGWQTLVSTMAIISVNLAVLNLLPIPALDGGQLVLTGIEAVRRRRLSEAALENFQKIGFVFIMVLFVLVTYNDLSRFWASMLRSVKGMF